jgi:hypothetical protein
MNWQIVRDLAMALPGTEEGTSYGTPAVKVHRKLFVRLHQDGDALVVRSDPAQRAMRMRADPETYIITDHYRNYPWVLVRLASVTQDELSELLEEAWALCAPPRLVRSRREGPK